MAIEKAAEEKRKKQEQEALARKIQAEKDKRRKEMLKAEADRKRRIQLQQYELKQQRQQLQRIKVQEAQKAVRKTLTINRVEISDPEGLYFNNEIILLMVAVGLGLFLLGLCIAYCIFRAYKRNKDAQIKKILSSDLADLDEGLEIDRFGNIVKKTTPQDDAS